MSSIVFIFFLCCSSILALESTNPRIIDGELSREGQFPYAVAITYETNGNISLCGGTLLSRRWILTAAHCILNSDQFTVYLGSLNINQPSSNGQVLKATDVFPHQNYSSLTLNNNIGLILLPSAVTLTSNIQPIDLPSQSLAGNQAVTTVGWGVTSDTSAYANIQYHVALSTITNQLCRDSGYGTQITDNMVCAVGINNQGTCRGDSGGPLIQINAENKPVVVGIASFYSGYGCELPYPSGFSRTFEYIEWIQNTMDANSSFSTVANVSLLAASVIFFIFSSLNLTL